MPCGPRANKRPPPRLAPFIGRTTELAEISRLLAQADCHLLTITGPGGVGKTRLAQEVAAAHRATFPHGVFFVPLAALTSPEFVVSALAEAIGLPFGTGSARRNQAQQIETYLAPRQLLLVPDNFEHLLAASHFLAQLLQAAPGVKILATSTERLNVQEEWLFHLRGLPLETARDELSGAAQMFLQAARKVAKGFALAPADHAPVERICQLVEGLPLSLELAAAWVTTLSCGEIAEEIERNLDFLSTAARNAPERHRSLRAVFEYAWRFLDAPEQAALARLALFNSGFTRVAAQRVAGADLNQLARLVNKSLLYRTAAGRYELHRALRHYAHQKAPAPVDAQWQLAQYYAQFLQARQTLLRGHGQKQAVEEIRDELENILAGWQFVIAHTAAALAQAYLEGLFWFYDICRRTRDAVEIFRQSVSAWESVSAQTTLNHVVFGKLLAWHGWFLARMGDVTGALAEIRRSLALFATLDAVAQEDAVLVNTLGLYLDAVENPEDAQRMAEASLAYYRAHQAPLGIALFGPTQS